MEANQLPNSQIIINPDFLPVHPDIPVHSQASLHMRSGRTAM